MSGQLHGIAVKVKKTGEIVDFVITATGRSALRVLSGMRMNLDHKQYEATETYIDKSKYNRLKEVKQ